MVDGKVSCLKAAKKYVFTYITEEGSDMLTTSI
jgi:hypothetical protein